MSYLSYTKNLDHNLLMFLLRDSERYMPIVAFFDQVTRNLSELSWMEAEMIAKEISKENRSEFCSGIRAGVVNALGCPPTLLESEKFQAAVAFALKVDKDARAITANHIQLVLDAGWSEQTVEDIVGIVAIQRLYNTIATGLGFKGMPEQVFADIGQDTVEKGAMLPLFALLSISLKGELRGVLDKS